MKSMVKAFKLALAVALAAGGLAVAGDGRVPQALQNAPAERDVRLVVPQEVLRFNVARSSISTFAGAGAGLTFLLDEKINADRMARSAAAIAPIREGMAGLDADALAMAASNKALAAMPWIKGQLPAGEPIRDSSLGGLERVLDSAETPQVVIFECIYDLSPDFSALRVTLHVRVANRAPPPGKKSAMRIEPRYMAYDQMVASIFLLDKPAKDVEANARRWAADDAALARRAVRTGFTDLSLLAGQAFSLSDADVKSMGDTNRKTITVGGIRGRLQEEGPDGRLLYNGGLVRVRTVG
jgi:hypothetical protein